MSADVLYLSFDGMTDPLGRSQVLPYLVGLAGRGHRIRLISLEKSRPFRRDSQALGNICRSAGIAWHPLPYRAIPPLLSSIVNLLALRRAAAQLHRARAADFVHARSDLPAISGLWLKRRFGLPLLYDMRAFWPDERAEGGAWDQSRWLYRLLFHYFKRRQRELLAEADEVVTLAQEGDLAISQMGVRSTGMPVTIIPCCADFDLFAPPSPEDRESARAEAGLDGNAPLLIHVGSIGCNCMLDEMLDFFTVYRDHHPLARFLFIAPAGEETIRAGARLRGVDDAVDVRSARREEVARWIGAADLGIMLVRPVWSKKAASPTKLGEMLAVGLPVVANAGVGDVAQIVNETGAGVVLDRFDRDAYHAAIDSLEPSRVPAAETRARARQWFDLAGGIEAYDSIYRRLAGEPVATATKERANA